MKKFKFSIAWLAVFAMIFTSCSKEEAGVISDDPETVQLTFGALLNSFNQQNKQASYECDSEAVPAYVMLGWSTEEDAGMDDYDLIQVDLVNNNGSWETVYSEDLAVPAGTYYLQHFAVYDASDAVLWVAPREGGAFAAEVDDPLPLTIELAAGTKPYIDVDVLCYFAREEVAYGYPFFDFDVIEVENSYCVFVNYCDLVGEGATGREYPAHFRLDIWSDGFGGSDLITTGMNEVDMTGDWPAASVLCVALPEIVGEDLYARVTVLDDGQAYTPEAGDVHEFRISQADLDDIEAGTPAYQHFRIGCDGDTPPPTGCIPAPVDGCVTLSFAETVSIEGFPVNTDPFYPLMYNGEEVGVITFDLEAAGAYSMDASIDLYEGWTATDVEISLPDFVNTDICVQNIDENDFLVTYMVDENVVVDGINFPVAVEFDANICFNDLD
ncbi:hypothetical protein [Salinimicrobium sp. TH3]|uniref:hypothetical protein n=1 Tax=Salinimicrobium sp. TH3 TaxID=2997342 RepID=UPI002272F7DE|nr:hypothetical protein [Salinimicrobium sp. TH3]MCY2686908.1 hypothetical protein [Salinimicrobium sp. TH3]